MSRPRLWLAGLGICCWAFASAVQAAAPPKTAGSLTPALRPEALADKIDEMIAAVWQAKGVKPAPVADDSEFLRRLYLDLGGRIPRVQEVRAFLDDPSADKRRREVEKLLDPKSPYYVSHFTNFWRAQMVPQSNNQFAQAFGPQLDTWLKKRLRENTPYDKMVREVLTAPVTFRQPRGAPGVPAEPTPLAFYQANEMKPENLAAATSRLFLGVKLECAQCHNHPFAKWKRDQFWEYAAFFSPIQTPRGQANVYAATEAASKREIAIPNTDKVVQARYLDGTQPRWKDAVGTRETLADWVTSPENPYFARALVNRLWAHFFGVGIVEPVDEESEENPPSHPELLNELARQFVLHGFDLKYLIRAITYSKTYQLSSTATGEPPDPRTFARMNIKGLTAEQLFDAIALATGYKEQGPAGQQRFAGFGATGVRAEFLQRFTNHSDKRTEYQTSILQALALMNGKFVSDATSLDVQRSQTLAGVIDAPFLDTAGKVEVLYLAALSRKPRPEELSRVVPYVERGGPSGDKAKALADVFWALLNSSEFILNH